MFSIGNFARTLLWVSSTLAVFGQQPCEGLDVRTYDGYLNPIRGVRISLSGRDTAVQLTDRDGGACLFVASGTYTLDVSAAGFRRQSSSIGLDGRGATLLVVLKVSTIGEVPLVTIKGRIERATQIATKDVWVVLSHVVGSERRVSRLSPNGEFTFRGDFAGYYEIKAVIGQRTVSCASLAVAHDCSVTLEVGRGCVEPGGIPGMKRSRLPARD